MSEDLVTWFKEANGFAQGTKAPHKWVLQAEQELRFQARRIEELAAENHLLKNSGIVEVAVRNPSVMEYMKHWEGRAEAAEAKLAMAVEALEGLIELHSLSTNEINPKSVLEFARTTLAELTGGGDE